MRKKRRADWSPTMEQRSSLEGRQLKCLTASKPKVADYFALIDSIEKKLTQGPPQ
jgi:hypothetical protein